VVALRAGRVAGYLIGATVLPAPTSHEAQTLRPRSARVRFAGHAVRQDETPALYRELYAALAPRWLAAGCFTHYVLVPAADEGALEAWHSLGFGLEVARAVRDTGPVAGPAHVSAVEVHRAGPEDLPAAQALAGALARYHAAPPIFLPYLAETEAAQRDHQRELLADDRVASWLAHQDGRPVGMQVLQPPPSPPDPATPERSVHLHEGFTVAAARGSGVGTALLDRSMAWARAQGYERCTVSWFTANLLAHRFWTGNGFRPLSYRLARTVDDRIAWAVL